MGHLQANDFEVVAKDVMNAQLVEIKSEYGVPQRLEGCHTAIVEGYVIEGHVPADVIMRLLDEKPEVVGLSVPGMPVGSPGMEGPNGVSTPGLHGPAAPPKHSSSGGASGSQARPGARSHSGDVWLAIKSAKPSQTMG